MDEHDNQKQNKKEDPIIEKNNLLNILIELSKKDKFWMENYECEVEDALKEAATKGEPAIFSTDPIAAKIRDVTHYSGQITKVTSRIILILIILIS